MQQYTQAAEMLFDQSVFLKVVTYLIAGALLLILAANVVEAAKKLFFKNNTNVALEKHCKDAEERFIRGERHIAENHDHIVDLKEGNKNLCLAVMALLSHAIHNGNTDEMTNAYAVLKSYLINRK